jgi:plasmid stabilization system protein ParE
VKVLWAAGAEQDRQSIFDHISAENPHAALNMDQRFSVAAAGLARWPRKGRPGRVAGTRELLVHEHYVLIYETNDAAHEINILAVLHTSRQWPSGPER